MTSKLPFNHLLVFLCALSLSLGANAQQWLGSSSSTGPVVRSGNVAIGTTSSPIAQLDVRGSNIYLAPSGSSGFSNKFIGLGESGGDCNIYGMRVQTKSTAYINVGVKQPNGFITQGDDIKFNPTVAWGDEGIGAIPCFPGGNCFGPIDRPLNFEYDGNDAGCGDVVVSMHSPSMTYQMQVNGSARASGSFISSDARYKRNVQDLKSALSTVNQLRGVSYGFNQQEFAAMNLPDGRTNGFIAQEVKEIMPEIVATDEAGFHAINYDAVVPVLVEAIKEQNAIVEAQNSAIQDLSRQLEELKAIVLANGSSKLGSAAGSGLNAEKATLYQNQPNPFGGQTSIPYFLSQDVRQAQLVITNINGQEMAVLQLAQRGQGEATLDSSTLESGVYTYTLVVDGVRAGSRRMVVSR